MCFNRKIKTHFVLNYRTLTAISSVALIVYSKQIKTTHMINSNFFSKTKYRALRISSSTRIACIELSPESAAFHVGHDNLTKAAKAFWRHQLTAVVVVVHLSDQRLLVKCAKTRSRPALLSFLNSFSQLHPSGSALYTAYPWSDMVDRSRSGIPSLLLPSNLYFTKAIKFFLGPVAVVHINDKRTVRTVCVQLK